MEVSQTQILIASTRFINKSSIISSLNTRSTEQSSNQTFVDADSFDGDLSLITVIQNFRSLLELYPFEARPDIFASNLNVKWVILEEDMHAIRHSKNIRANERRQFIYLQKKLREIAGYYGIPIVGLTGRTPQQVNQAIFEIVRPENYDFIRVFEMKSMTFQKLMGFDLEGMICKKLILEQDNNLPESLIQQLTKDGVFDNQVIERAKDKLEFRAKLVAKWLVAGEIKVLNGKIVVQRQNLTISVNKNYALHLTQQGQSKLLFSVLSQNPYFNNFVFIVLKSTIYSHKKQSTGLIQNLGKVRAYGSKIFLEFLNRNDLDHAYRCVNQEGIIMSEFQKVVPVEIVFKKYFVGTDKHSYYGMGKIPSLVVDTAQYHNGIYIRFDWRNPNHISIKTQTDLAENPYYFLIQNEYTKNIFFDTFLNNPTKCLPYGDKCVYPQLLHGLIDIERARFSLIKLYCTFEYYMREVGLQILDGCFMLSQDANTFWSEINPDCMRIKSNNLSEEYDKDIWRAGGSSSKQDILKKWTTLNEILTKYLLTHREFLNSDYPYRQIASSILSHSTNLIPSYRHIYAQLSKPKTSRKEIIVTIDISKSMPSLVVSSAVSQVHSEGDIHQALQRIKFFDDILLVNLDGAFKDKQNAEKNKQLIKAIAKKQHILTGGGIHTMQDVEELLNSGVRKIVIASNTTPQFLSSIPKDRLIVELSINQLNEVLIDGRKTNTKINVINKMQQLVQIGVRTFSITFVHKQGHLKGLPYQQIEDLMRAIPNQVQKLIIAGGITSMDDLRFLWRFDRVVPQVGSAIWKNKIRIGEIFSEMGNYDEKGLIPAVIKSNTGMVKGQMFLDSKSLAKTVETGYLHRYSRQHKRVMRKGDTSGDEQKVSKVSFDCDADCLLITVQSNQPLCHNGSKSCFHCQNLSFSTLSQINEHIKSRIRQKSYSGLMQTNPGLALSKMLEETWEIAYADRQHQVHECADLLSHFLMYINGKEIQLQSIIQELNSRTAIVKKNLKVKQGVNVDKVIIGIAHQKQRFNLEILLRQLGVEIVDQGDGVVRHKVIDKLKYLQYFGESEISFLYINPMDLSHLLTIGLVDMVICLNITINNYPEVSVPILETKAYGYKLCLLKKKDQTVDISESNKLSVASQFVKQSHGFITKKLNVPEESLSIIRVNGNGSSYLSSQSHSNISLCDCLIYKNEIHGSLEIFETVIPEKQISIGLYKSLRV